MGPLDNELVEGRLVTVLLPGWFFVARVFVMAILPDLLLDGNNDAHIFLLGILELFFHLICLERVPWACSRVLA